MRFSEIDLEMVIYFHIGMWYTVCSYSKAYDCFLPLLEGKNRLYLIIFLHLTGYIYYLLFYLLHGHIWRTVDKCQTQISLIFKKTLLPLIFRAYRQDYTVPDEASLPEFFSLL